MRNCGLNFGGMDRLDMHTNMNLPALDPTRCYHEAEVDKSMTNQLNSIIHIVKILIGMGGKR